MSNFKLPHFGFIDPGSLEDYYDSTFSFNETQVQIDLNFENKTVDPTLLVTVKHFIENIRIHDINNKGSIKRDFEDEDGDTVRFYLTHHLEELGREELDSLIDPRSKKSDHEKILLNKLHLVRVGIYPDSEEQFAIFDYSIGQELTNYLVVIHTDENGNIDYMTMES